MEARATGRITSQLKAIKSAIDYKQYLWECDGHVGTYDGPIVVRLSPDLDAVDFGHKMKELGLHGEFVRPPREGDHIIVVRPSLAAKIDDMEEDLFLAPMPHVNKDILDVLPSPAKPGMLALIENRTLDTITIEYDGQGEELRLAGGEHAWLADDEEGKSILAAIARGHVTRDSIDHEDR